VPAFSQRCRGWRTDGTLRSLQRFLLTRVLPADDVRAALRDFYHVQACRPLSHVEVLTRSAWRRGGGGGGSGRTSGGSGRTSGGSTPQLRARAASRSDREPASGVGTLLRSLMWGRGGGGSGAGSSGRRSNDDDSTASCRGVVASDGDEGQEAAHSSGDAAGGDDGAGVDGDVDGEPTAQLALRRVQRVCLELHAAELSDDLAAGRA